MLLSKVRSLDGWVQDAMITQVKGKLFKAYVFIQVIVSYSNKK